VTPQQHRRARDLFEAALDRDPGGDITRWLEDAEPDDVEVRGEVRSLLQHHTRAGAFLTQPLVEVAPHLLDEENTLDPGAVLGTYTIIRELGRGGMGRVYLANDGRLGRTVALKALAPELTRDPIHRERLRREARAAAVLTHPGICTVYALEEFNGELYIVTEFVEGHTLRDEMVGKRPSPDSILSSAHDLASALAGAHVKGITHRDLKPENIMRLRDGRLKILDFGLARMDVDGGAPGTVTAATAPGALAGTPAYMAPEQIEGQKVSMATDVFAYGVVMYEWISGVHPFQAASSLATLARVMDTHPEPLSTSRGDLPRFVSDIIDRCLKKSPSARFQSAVELCDAFEKPGSAVRYSSGSSTWWRVHQLTAMILYIVATTRAWQIKESLHSPMSLWAFILMGIAASLGGIVRGHLIFTDVMNRPHLGPEMRRTRRAVVSADLLMAATLAADALLLAHLQPLNAVLTICVAVGIALASILMEPATTTAVFGDL
jgi:serine/threonine protein kinase